MGSNYQPVCCKPISAIELMEFQVKKATITQFLLTRFSLTQFLCHVEWRQLELMEFQDPCISCVPQLVEFKVRKTTYHISKKICLRQALIFKKLKSDKKSFRCQFVLAYIQHLVKELKTM